MKFRVLLAAALAAFSFAALAQQPIKIGMSMPQTGGLGAGGKSALIATVGLMRRLRNSFSNRQKPTRMPYSCQLQLGTSGSSTAPVGAGSTCRAMARAMSHTSRLTMVQTTTRARPGSLSGGRSTMAE